jgi:hypothetical protein
VAAIPGDTCAAHDLPSRSCGEQSKHAMDAMLKMQKIIVADLQKAHDGYSCPEKFFPKT